MRLLAIDYGRRRLGLAFGVEGIIETRGWLDREKNKVLEKISDICCEEKVDRVIIGVTGSWQIKEEVESFAKQLRRMIKLPIDFIDETLTSWEAEKMVGWKKKGRIDTVAAALILRRYLDFKLK